jgi:hypothetical protein
MGTGWRSSSCDARFLDGQAGASFDMITIDAYDPYEAIAIAETYQCSSPGVSLSVAVLTDSMGSPVWSRRGLDDTEASGGVRAPIGAVQEG